MVAGERMRVEELKPSVLIGGSMLVNCEGVVPFRVRQLSVVLAVYDSDGTCSKLLFSRLLKMQAMILVVS